MTYPIDVNGMRFTWPDRYITASQIRDLVSVPQSYGVWQSTDRSTDPPIDDRADLEDSGGFSLPRFFTGMRLTTQGNAGVETINVAATVEHQFGREKLRDEFWNLIHEWADGGTEERIEWIEQRLEELCLLRGSSGSAGVMPTDHRRDFENEWIRYAGHLPKRDGDGYAHGPIDLAWRFWKAASGVKVVCEAPSGGVIWTPEDEARLDAAIAKRAAARGVPGAGKTSSEGCNGGAKDAP